MPVLTNPAGTNGPRQRKTTGRLRNALTNIASKQNPFPERLVRRAPYAVRRMPYTPATAAQVQVLPVPRSVDPAKMIELLRARTQTPIPEQSEQVLAPTVPPANVGDIAAQTISTLALLHMLRTAQTGGKGGGALPKGGSPQANMALGKALAAQMYGWTGRQWQALKELWTRESGWRTEAVNPSSGAAGIPQRLLSAHPFESSLQRQRWMNDPRMQILWGLRYIAARYGDPVRALQHSDQRGWY